MAGPALDVLVIGGGPAGAIAARALLDAGVRVRVLEAGPRTRVGAPAPLVDERAWAYVTAPRPIEWLRARAFGGRALTWGGWTQRFPERVLSEGGFPYGARALASAYADVEARLGVVEGRVDARYVDAARALELVARAKRGAMRDGRPWTPHDARLARAVRTEQVALDIVSSSGRARGARVLDVRSGAVRHLEARAVVLAASPVETARLLLASERAGEDARVGRGLVDHLVVGYVLVEPRPAPDVRGRGAFPGAVTFDRFVNLGDRRTARDYRGGFSLEVDGPHPLATIPFDERARLGVDGLDLASTSFTLVHAIGEMFPHPRRRVSLADARDALGRRAPRISFVFTRDERAMAADMRAACVAVADAIAPPGSTLVPSLDSLEGRVLAHEAGTCAMGRDDESACDAFGRLRVLDRTWVADASALPTSGDRHPSLTILAHARRVAHDVARTLARDQK